MSRKTSFMIFTIALIAILVSYIANFAVVTKEVNAVFSAMQNIYVAISAVVLALLISKTKHYWLIMLGVSVVAAIIIQVVIGGGALMSVALLYKVAAFIVYTYLVQLVRYMW